jgi:PAS domain-containing protein
LIATLLTPGFLIGAALAALGLLGTVWMSRPEGAVAPARPTPGGQAPTPSGVDPAIAETDPPEAPGEIAASGDAVFLFHDDDLADATPAAERLIGHGTRWACLVALLQQRFPGVATWPGSADGTERLPSALPDDPGILEVTRRGRQRTVTLHDSRADAADRHLWLSGTESAAQVRGMLDHAPVAIWALDPEGRLSEANAAFRQLAEITGRDMPFEISAEDAPTPRRRVRIDNPQNDARQWFDLSTHDMPDGTRVCFAANADAVVTAEVAQRNFVQTLTKTFAQLSIGLAIFDRHRQLALFNPALIDLTSLPADFLSARPTLPAFFDLLRDRQIMPEPRNYKTWRYQLSDMITAARDGAYCETWTLPNGLTYRISGKPHPDGAVAFLFEDISAEITLTRRFRAELEQSQAVMDAIDGAIAVFSRSGVLTFANRAFREMWKCSPDESFIELTVLDISKIWQEQCAPSPVWGDLRDFVRSVDDRTDWQDSVVHKTLGPLSVLAAPVTGGATLVRFAERTTARAR